MNMNEFDALVTVFKAVSHKHRLQILKLLSESKPLSLEDVARGVNLNYKTCSVHVAQMHQAGLVDKMQQSRSVMHRLTPKGKTLMKSIQKLDYRMARLD